MRDTWTFHSAGQLIFGIPFVFWLIGITLVTLLLEIFVSYPVYARFLKYLTLSLFGYVVVFLVVKQDFSKIVFSTFIPWISFSK